MLTPLKPLKLAKLELYGDTDLTDAQLQNRIDAIEGISKPAFVTVEYGWDSGQSAIYNTRT